MFVGVAPPTTAATSSDREKKMEQLLLTLQLELLALLLGEVIGQQSRSSKQSCPIVGHGVREHTFALHQLYRTEAGEIIGE